MQKKKKEKRKKEKKDNTTSKSIDKRVRLWQYSKLQTPFIQTDGTDGK